MFGGSRAFRKTSGPDGGFWTTAVQDKGAAQNVWQRKWLEMIRLDTARLYDMFAVIVFR